MRLPFGGTDSMTLGNGATYSYDPRQMLSTADGPWGALGFTYDPAGNRAARSLTPPGGGASTDTYTYEPTSNGLDVIDNPATGSRGYSHDGAGNTVAATRTLAGAGNWSYVYNDAGRLASVSLNGGLQAEYLYNALGQQVSRTAWPGALEAVTLSVHDLGGNRLAEHDQTGAVIREYIWLDGRPLAVVEGGQLYHLHWDHILRPVLATDATGAVVWAARYLPFGGIDQVYVDTLALAQNLRFPGQWFQAETGLHQNWMRDYDPTTGRYLQADPLGLVDGPSVYGYARQSPVRIWDVMGLYCSASTTTVYCNFMGTGVSFPRPQDWPDVLSSSIPNYHQYYFETEVPGTLAECIMAELLNNPTPGVDTPATPQGSLNDALGFGCGFQKYRTAITLIPGQPFQ
jgi:RHS repeat-associated protein